MGRGAGDHWAVEQARKEVTFEVPPGRAGSRGNIPPFKNNFKDPDAQRVHTCSSRAPSTGLDFTGRDRTQLRYKCCLLSWEAGSLLTLLVVCGVKLVNWPLEMRAGSPNTWSESVPTAVWLSVECVPKHSHLVWPQWRGCVYSCSDLR